MTSPSFPQVGSAFDVDVVVLGGGIQGLWLLADLTDRGYSAILLERARPGFGQTGHAHVFIHEGHIYGLKYKTDTFADVVQRMESVREAHERWKDALQPGGRLASLVPLKSDFYVGLRDKNKATDFVKTCKLAQIAFNEVAPSSLSVAQGIERLFKGEGFCLDSKALLDGFISYGGVGQRVGRCTEIRVDSYDAGRFSLSVQCDSNLPLDIRARSLVLSAGAGNERLVNQLFGKIGAPPDADAARQQTVKTFMLVLRHKNGSLLPTSGWFPDAGGIFLVSRKDAAGGTVWLIADRQRELVSHPGEITAFDAAAWFKKFKIELDKLLPSVPSNPYDYEWGIYEATKAEPHTVDRRFTEGGAFPKNYHVHKHQGAPVWLTWPSLLTFAPLVAEQITQEVASSISLSPPPASWKPWDDFRVSPLTPGECRWKTTNLLNWDDFTRGLS